MSKPNSFHTIPNPHSTVTGRNYTDSHGPLSLGKQARKYRPRGTQVETTVATLSRFAAYLIDRETGRAYSADEIRAAPIPVATNTLKKALTGVPPNATYLVTGEANRIEQYMGDLNGGAETNDDNWVVIGPNTVDLWLQNNEYTTAVFSHPDGNVSIGYSGGMIRVGWIQEHKAYSVTGMPQTAYAYQINGFNADIANWPVLMVRPSQMTKFYLPPIFPPRAQVKLVLD